MNALGIAKEITKIKLMMWSFLDSDYVCEIGRVVMQEKPMPINMNDTMDSVIFLP